jgi:hypothetical protein
MIAQKKRPALGRANGRIARPVLRLPGDFCKAGQP